MDLQQAQCLTGCCGRFRCTIVSLWSRHNVEQNSHTVVLPTKARSMLSNSPPPTLSDRSMNSALPQVSSNLPAPMRLLRITRQSEKLCATKRSTFLGYLSESFCGYLGRPLTCRSGSYRAQHYAAKYPDHVGNFVVDAVTAPGMVSNSLKGIVGILTLLRLFSIKPTPGYWQETEHYCGPMRIARMIPIVPSSPKAKPAFLPSTAPYLIP